jgi:hypothetical protein
VSLTQALQPHSPVSVAMAIYLSGYHHLLARTQRPEALPHSVLLDRASYRSVVSCRQPRCCSRSSVHGTDY